MISRSVPLYNEVQLSCAKLCSLFAQSNSCIVDLGCSTASSLILSAKSIKDTSIKHIGVDASPAMLEKANVKISALQLQEQIELIEADILSWTLPERTSVVLMNYTLQFIPPNERQTLLENIYESLMPGGVLLLSEKVKHNHPKLHNALDTLHLQFKSDNGYSELEIAQKRTAIEKVMIPQTTEENLKLLSVAGFDDVEPFLKWYN
ncbi:UNVERIFIED_CONTAM: hypothetical protein GTU68_027376, partial [Idotea baltica]|nr:hypothetical protein [Idotea baltica]